MPPFLQAMLVRCAALAVWLGLAACGGPAVPPTPVAPPVVAALESAGLPALVRGHALLGELGCVACHDRGSLAVEAAAGPDLRSAGTRIAPRYLRDFLAAPHAHEPGTVMPDLLQRWQGDERARRADALAHFVRSLAPEIPTAVAPGPDDAAAARGAELYRRIGCVACHDTTPPAALGAKYSHASLQAFLLAPHEARPSRRMPDFALSPAEATSGAKPSMRRRRRRGAPCSPSCAARGATTSGPTRPCRPCRRHRRSPLSTPRVAACRTRKARGRTTH
jgi:cytochrome c551/c552